MYKLLFCGERIFDTFYLFCHLLDRFALSPFCESGTMLSIGEAEANTSTLNGSIVKLLAKHVNKCVWKHFFPLQLFNQCQYLG